MPLSIKTKIISKYLRDNNPEIYESKTSGRFYTLSDSDLKAIGLLQLTKDDFINISDLKIRHLTIDIKLFLQMIIWTTISSFVFGFILSLIWGFFFSH